MFWICPHVQCSMPSDIPPVNSQVKTNQPESGAHVFEILKRNHHGSMCPERKGLFPGCTSHTQTLERAFHAM